MRLSPLLGLALGLSVLRPALADDPIKPTATASEKNPAVPAAGHSLHGEAFDEGPRQKAYLKEGQGRIDFKVTTAKPEAQAFINQGVAQIHSFYYLEAERSFRQAAQIDPDCPMAYWGMAMANVNNSRRAQGFFKEAKKKAETTKLSRRETLYLDAMSALYKDGGNHSPAFLAGMEDLVNEFPEDIDAKAWLAMLIWQNGNVGSARQAIDSLLVAVEKVEPLHPGAHHYRIHLWDSIKYPRAELGHHVREDGAGIAHAWHMPGHTFTGLQRYGDAAYQQEGSARVDHAAMIRDRIMPFEIHNYSHNNQWLATSLSHVGRARDAIAVARNLVEQPRDPQKNNKTDGGSPQRNGRARWSEVLVKYELWDELIAATTSGQLDWSDVPFEKREKAYTLGLAYAAKGDKGKLSEQIETIRALDGGKATPASLTALPSRLTNLGAAAKAAPAAAPATPAATVSAELAELEGHLRLLNDDIPGAFDLFAKSTRMRGESLARAQVSARNLGFAPAIARKAVQDNPNQVVPLAACVEILQICGKTKEAQEVYAKLEPLARQADRDVPVFQRLAPVIESWKSSNWMPAEVPKVESSGNGDSHVDLSTLGPLAWSPYPAEPIQAADTDSRPWTLASHKGATCWWCSTWVASVPTACSNFARSGRRWTPSRRRIPTSWPSAATIWRPLAR